MSGQLIWMSLFQEHVAVNSYNMSIHTRLSFQIYSLDEAGMKDSLV